MVFKMRFHVVLRLAALRKLAKGLGLRFWSWNEYDTWDVRGTLPAVYAFRDRLEAFAKAEGLSLTLYLPQELTRAKP